MSKKHERRKAHGGDGHKEIKTPALQARARAALDAGRWRDAIAALKALLKRERRDDWRAALASAYAGRAGELTEKGMLKEALAIWENRAALDPELPMAAGHAALLVRLGQAQAVLDLLHAGTLPAAQHDAIRAQLAARVLGGDQGLLEQLSPDDPVRRHAEAARTALTAYCDQDDEALRAALAAIPFRSPYRDWAHILKALLRRAEAPAEAQSLLARVDEASAFAPMKRAAQLSLSPDGELPAAAAAAGPTVVRVACVLRGWPRERIAVFEDLRRLGSDPGPRALVRLLHRHCGTLGADWVRRQSLSLVAQARDIGAINWLREAGGSHPGRFEQALLAAWTTEPQRDPWLSLERWQHCADLLKRRWQESQDPELALRIALLLRRGDAEGDMLGPPAEPSGDPDYFDTIAAAQLEASLSWDPDDRPTYLRLIDYYRRGRRLKDARRVLEQAQSRWPDDMALLEASLDIALDAGSFKKATGLARRILDMDPINTGVRRRLVDAHLGHARKQVTKDRTDLARRELAAAADWARGEQVRARIALMTALLAVIDDDAAGVQALREQAKAQDAGLAGRLELMLAADALGLALGTTHTRLGLRQPKVRDGDDLVAAMLRLRAALDADQALSAETREALEATLPKAPWGSLTRAQLEAACDTLQRYQLDKARRQAATAALKRWRGEPVFELHRFEAKHPGGFDFRAMKDLFNLEAALDRAREAGDMRTAMRIEAALPAFGPGGALGGGPADFPPVSFPFEGDAAEDEAVPENFLELVRAFGIRRALEVLGAPAELIRRVKEIEHELGAEAAAELLVQFLVRGDIDPLADLPLPKPAPRPPRVGRRKSQGPVGRADDDDDNPEQMDLF